MFQRKTCVFSNVSIGSHATPVFFVGFPYVPTKKHGLYNGFAKELTKTQLLWFCIGINEQAKVLQWSCIGSTKNTGVTMVLHRNQRHNCGFTAVLHRNHTKHGFYSGAA